MKDVRYRPEGWEGKCNYCHEWWPLTLDFWRPVHGLSRCGACLKTVKNELARTKYQTDADYREQKRLEARQQRLVKQSIYGKARWQRIKNDPARLAEHRARSGKNLAAFRDRQRQGEQAA